MATATRKRDTSTEAPAADWQLTELTVLDCRPASPGPYGPPPYASKIVAVLTGRESPAEHNAALGAGMDKLRSEYAATSERFRRDSQSYSRLQSLRKTLHQASIDQRASEAAQRSALVLAKRRLAEGKDPSEHERAYRVAKSEGETLAERIKTLTPLIEHARREAEHEFQRVLAAKRAELTATALKQFESGRDEVLAEIADELCRLAVADKVWRAARGGIFLNEFSIDTEDTSNE